ncbi:two-component system response regulator YesN [Paenibacillus phyllosphaerae]|uniref:Two-component system response regulator YesN n=1 Tax=Paenibacillus phyllosphaerae TaxID=274593 RepID=A0A7W5AVY1_9BACL|nr:response regulator [Paenibacillus phyllosphaerae]MBB3109775.1 two-component system response regulator YesN [Paenibacillus phyllosphaerae]
MHSLLIVDDEKNIRMGLRSMIEREFAGEYTFYFAADGEEALACLAEVQVDVIITDIRMPVMDGIALINELHGREQKPGIIILSGYDDFHYAKAAIRCEVKEYLLKPIVREELFGVLRRLASDRQRKDEVSGQLASTQALREDYAASLLNNLLASEGTAADGLTDQLVHAGLEWLEDGYYLSLLKPAEMSTSGDRRDFVQQIDSLMLHAGNVRLRFYDKDGRLVVLSPSYAPFERLSAYMQGERAIRFRAGLSSRRSGAMAIKEGYAEAIRALSYSLLQTSPDVINYADIHDRNTNHKLPLESIQKIANMLGCDRDQELKRVLQHVLDIRAIMRYDIGYLEGISRSLNELVFDKVFQLYGEESIHLLKLHKTVGNLYNFDHFHDYYHAVENLLELLSDYVKQVRLAHNDRGEIQRAITYMQANYQHDLNMAMVSNHVSLNYSYFSQAFKDYTGETFVSYLRKLRLQKAKELLTATDLKVYEISASAGFENVKHFTRVFRETEGVSPLEYRTVHSALKQT